MMAKEEAIQVIRSKGFENFFDKTSRIMERALNTEFDIVGNFFEEEEGNKEGEVVRGERISH